MSLLLDVHGTEIAQGRVAIVVVSAKAAGG